MVAMFAGQPVSAEASDVHYIALGDSYSSGEANGPYFQSARECRRSAAAWPWRITKSSDTVWLRSHLACSGAEVEHVMSSSFKGQAPQISELRRSIRAIGRKPDVVTITIGGNDAGFGDVLRNCVLRNCVRTGRLREAAKDVRALRPRLTRAYTRLAREIAPGTLVVVGYPRLFPRKRGTAGRRCAWLARNEQRGLNLLTRYLDRVLHQAVRSVSSNARLRKPRFVSVLDALDGHELCTARSWVRSLTLRGGSERGHPLLPGQLAIARAVKPVLERVATDRSTNHLLPTVVSRYSPFTESGAVDPALETSTHGFGYCYTPEATGRRDAWRCRVDNVQFNPCFKSPSRSTVVCNPNPATRKATVILSPTFESRSENDYDVTILFLRIGERFCTFIPGMSVIVNDRRANFSCLNGDFVWGEVDRAQGTWHVLVGQEDSSTWSREPVERAWH